MAARIGKTVFLSYRGGFYPHVAPVRQWLRSAGLAGDATFMKPEELALDHELLMPFEVFEFMLAIWQRMEKCDAFAYINSQDYLSSIWTTLEVTGWRFFPTPRPVTPSDQASRVTLRSQCPFLPCPLPRSD